MQKADTGSLEIIGSQFLGRPPSIIFGISTRKGGVSPEPLGMNLSFHVGDNRENVIRNRSLFFGALLITEDRLAIPAQVHGATAAVVTGAGRYPECDALVTNQRDVYLTVTIADCVPVFLVDSEESAVAAIHAGWRGTAGGIVGNVVRLMTEKFGCSPSSMTAYLGPSAESCCYEVGEEVAARLPDAAEQRNGRLYVSLRKANKNQLMAAGFARSRIETSSLCTICASDLLHSYRRDGASSGRMMGVIGMKQ